MTIVNLQDMKRSLKKYLQRVKQGETLLVLENGHPVAEVRPVPSENMRQRPFGLARDEFQAPDDFDEPLPEEVLALFEGR